MHNRYYSTKLQVFQEHFAPRLICAWFGECAQTAYGNLPRLASSPQERARQCFVPMRIAPRLMRWVRFLVRATKKRKNRYT